MQQSCGEGKEESLVELFIAQIYFLERLLRHSLCVSSMRAGKAVLLDVYPAKQELTATSSWRQQTPEPSASWVPAHARLGMLLSSPWAFSSMVDQDPHLGPPNRTSISSQAQRQVSKTRNRNTTRRCQKKWHDRSCTVPTSLPAQGTGHSVAVSGRADGTQQSLRDCEKCTISRDWILTVWDERTLLCIHELGCQALERNIFYLET